MSGCVLLLSLLQCATMVLTATELDDDQHFALMALYDAAGEFSNDCVCLSQQVRFSLTTDDPVIDCRSSACIRFPQSEPCPTTTTLECLDGQVVSV
jgi:hypothetical protein